MAYFEDLLLPEVLLTRLEQIKFNQATPIQAKAIPLLMGGKDLMACAQTGSGKTAAYLLPMVTKVLDDPKIQGLVLAPTRELAQQICDFLRTLLEFDHSIHTALLVGGQDIRKQFKTLQKKPRIVVATPGRLIDHLKRNTLQIHNVSQLVLDEGDRMIDMGFAPQLEQILKYLSNERQTSFFTATLDEKVKKLAQKYLHKPESLMIEASKPVQSIKQSIVKVEPSGKSERLLDEINGREGSVIVFFRTKRGTDKALKYLRGFGVKVEMLHGGRSQSQRNQALLSLRKGKSRVLCATDVAARGIDVPSISHVINFDLPQQDEDYVHRIGRTGRNGASGEAVSFVTKQEYVAWNRLVRKFDIKDGMIAGVKSGKSDSKKASGGRRSSGKSKSSGDSRKFSRKSSPKTSKQATKKASKKTSQWSIEQGPDRKPKNNPEKSAEKSSEKNAKRSSKRGSEKNSKNSQKNSQRNFKKSSKKASKNTSETSSKKFKGKRTGKRYGKKTRSFAGGKKRRKSGGHQARA